MRHLLCFLFPSLCLNLNVVFFLETQKYCERDIERRSENKQDKKECLYAQEVTKSEQ